MSADQAQFVFMTCRPGAENALKREVARSDAEWRFAFSRPGFLTFKVDAATPLDDRKLAERHWVLAHSHGISLGRLQGEQLTELVAQLWQEDGPIVATIGEDVLTDVHAWQLEAGTKELAAAASDAFESPAYETPLAVEVDAAIRAAAPEQHGKLRKHINKSAAKPRRHASLQGALVLDVVVLAPGEWWVGYHRAVTSAARWPGGQVPAPLPEHAVSRAYAKLEEAIAWSGLPIAAGDEAVEIGCAPGGASQALLDRGLFVTGIDPADVDPVLLTEQRFRHLKKRGKEVRRSEFLGVRWLVADMNIAPQSTLAEVEPIVTHPGVAIRGLVLTLKLSDWNAAEQLEALAARVRSWGYRDVRMRQLVSGGQEVSLVALKRRALRRLGRKLNHKRKPARGRKSPASGKAAAVRKRGDKPHSDVPAPHF